MRHVLKQRHHPGQAIPVLALTLLLLLAFSGLAIDGALAFAWRRNAENSADGAAMIATRALVVDRGSITGTDIDDAVRTYLQSELSTANPEYELEYVDPAGMPIGPIGTGAAPLNARGVRVIVRYTFPTYLMGVLGQPTLTVAGDASARFGNSGTVIGENIVPLGLLPEAVQFLRSNSTGAVIDLAGEIEDNNQQIITDWNNGLYPLLAQPQDHPSWVDPNTFVKRWQVRAVALQMGSTAAPSLGGGSACPSTPVNTLKSWWCLGAHQQINTRIANDSDQVALAMDLIGVAPSSSTHNRSLVQGGFLSGDVNNIIIMPVLAEAIDSDLWSGANPVYVIEYFVAVRLQSVNTTTGVIQVQYLRRHLTNGGLMGSNNNVERGDPCEVCVINLVRD